MNLIESNMTKEEKIKLICRNCQEILTEADLSRLIESGTPLSHYIGFEISGMVHLGTGLVTMGKVADFLQAGVKCRVFLADFHSYLNNKLGGNWKNIRWATENYFKEAMVASLKCWGVDEKQVEFIMGRDLYENNITHWETFMEVGQHLTLSRNLRSISIMGKQQGEDVKMATLFYPPLQVADIFTMGVNLAHAGMDQRKAHVVARQVAKKLKIKPLMDKNGDKIAPVAVHNALIAGLEGPTKGKGDEESLKMSKSKPSSAIFVHDSPDEIREKIRGAYGPPREVEHNPLINWVGKLVFWGEEEGQFEIKRDKRYGGKVVYEKLTDLVNDYKSGKLFPLDLKNGLTDWLIEKLAPARQHFDKNAKAKEGLKWMKKFFKK